MKPRSSTSPNCRRCTATRSTVWIAQAPQHDLIIATVDQTVRAYPVSS